MESECSICIAQAQDGEGIAEPATFTTPLFNGSTVGQRWRDNRKREELAKAICPAGQGPAGMGPGWLSGD